MGTGFDAWHRPQSVQSQLAPILLAIVVIIDLKWHTVLLSFPMVQRRSYLQVLKMAQH